MKNDTSERSQGLAEIWDGFRRIHGLHDTAHTADGEQRRAAREARQAARASRRTLERELADVISPADFSDLDAMLKRYSEEETEDIRTILWARRAA